MQDSDATVIKKITMLGLLCQQVSSKLQVSIFTLSLHGSIVNTRLSSDKRGDVAVEKQIFAC